MIALMERAGRFDRAEDFLKELLKKHKNSCKVRPRGVAPNSLHVAYVRFFAGVDTVCDLLDQAAQVRRSQATAGAQLAVSSPEQASALCACWDDCACADWAVCFVNAR